MLKRQVCLLQLPLPYTTAMVQIYLGDGGVAPIVATPQYPSPPALAQNLGLLLAMSSVVWQQRATPPSPVTSHAPLLSSGGVTLQQVGSRPPLRFTVSLAEMRCTRAGSRPPLRFTASLAEMRCTRAGSRPPLRFTLPATPAFRRRWWSAPCRAGLHLREGCSARVRRTCWGQLSTLHQGRG